MNQPIWIITIGGDCGLEIVPVSYLNYKYPNLGVIWFDANGRLAAPNDTTFTPMVSEPGLYEVLVTNTESGCTATLGGIEVTSNIDEPTANASGEMVLGREANASVILNATGSSTGDEFIYNWTASVEDALIRANEDEAEGARLKGLAAMSSLLSGVLQILDSMHWKCVFTDNHK